MQPKPELLCDGPKEASTIVALAHGAGAGMDTPFMNFFATGLANSGFRVVRFEFPYMAGYRKNRERKPPDREPTLRASWLSVVRMLEPKRLVIGGKSMGGRIASLVADEAGVAGLVCLGYPFHPVGKPEQLRTQHLETIKTPTLILQGERDSFGSRDDVAGYKLSLAVQMHWLKDGDHSFKPRKKSGRTEQQNWEEAINEFTAFVGSLVSLRS